MELQEKDVVVTGGAGFIGSHLVDKLVKLEADVTVLDDLSFGKGKNINDEADFEKVDIRNYEKVKELFAGLEPDLVYHMAANATTKESSMGWKDPIYDLEVNALGTLNLLRASVDSEIRPKFIFASSAAVYGDPQYTPMDEGHPTTPKSPYGVTKLTSEKYILAFRQEHQIPSSILRIFNCYGPRQPRYVMFDFMKKLKENPDELEVIGTGDQVRTYCYVSDAVDGMVDIAREDAFGEVYNLAGEDVITIGDLAKKVIEVMGLEKRAEIKYTGKSWEGDIVELVADTSKLKDRIGFEPRVSLEEGLLKLKNWFEKEYGE